MTKQEILEGLKSGRKLRCDRKDEPLLPWLLELCEAGTLRNKLVQADDQYSYVEFSWGGGDE